MKNAFKILTAVLFVTISFIKLEAINRHESTITKLGGAFCTFAGKFGGEVTLKELKNTGQIGVAGCAEGSEIYLFTLEITKNGKRSTYHGKSHKLTQEILNKLRLLDKGDSFVFKNMKAHLPIGGDVDVMGRPFVVI